MLPLILAAVGGCLIAKGVKEEQVFVDGGSVNKTKKQLEEEALKLYGGLNKNKTPFSVGDKLKQIYRLDDSDNLVEDGTEEWEYVGQKGDMMLIKPLNEDALFSRNTANQEVVNIARSKGFKPSMDNVLQLHYKYADRFEVVGEADKFASGGIIPTPETNNETWTEQEWPGNRSLQLQAACKLFGKIPVWVFGGTEDYPTFSFCVSAGANSIHSYSGGFEGKVTDIHEAERLVDEKYKANKLIK